MKISTRRFGVLSAGLTLLCLGAVLYQARVCAFGFERLFHSQDVAAIPFLMSSASATIDAVYGASSAAGIRPGDVLISVNNVPYTGTDVVNQAVAHSRPGAVLDVVVRSATSSAEKHVRVPLQMRGAQLAPSAFRTLQVSIFIRYFITPSVCLLLGFWVILQRPRNPLAWLLWVLLLGLSNFMLDPGVQYWTGALLRSCATGYYVFLISSLPLCLLLLGIYFPERLALLKRGPWAVLQWIIIIPILLLAAAQALVSALEVGNYSLAARIEHPFHSFWKFGDVLSVAAAGAFLVMLAVRTRLAASPDSRRRLRLLQLGTTSGLLPILCMEIVAVWRTQSLEEIFPLWLVVAALMLLIAFPLTLAYAVVVHKALQPQMAVREGIQYALTRSSVLAFQIAALLALFGASLRFSRNSGPPVLWICALGAVTCSIFLVQFNSAFHRLRRWIDKKFFHQVYAAEQVLMQLSEKLTAIVDSQMLLETVARQLADCFKVTRLAILLEGSPYRPAYTLGYPAAPEVVFTHDAETVQLLARAKQPALVHFDDPDSWIHHLPVTSDREKQFLSDLSVELLLPLVVREKLVGFISLGEKNSGEPYSRTEIRLLKSVSSQAGLALQNARLTAQVAKQAADQERLNREIEIAREVQERLFPQRLPVVPKLDYYGMCRPAFGVGGDYYDFFTLPNGNLGIALGDAAGKGIAAALMMASLHASLRSQAALGAQDLVKVVGNVNRLLYEAFPAERYATLFFAECDIQARTVRYVNAGHNPPMLFRRTSEGWGIHRLQTSGTVVGLLDICMFEQNVASVEPGDILVVFSDGITEAMNSSDMEWGESALEEAVRNSAALSASELAHQIVNLVDSFCAGAAQHDDMTISVLRFGEDNRTH